MNHENNLSEGSSSSFNLSYLLCSEEQIFIDQCLMEQDEFSNIQSSFHHYQNPEHQNLSVNILETKKSKLFEIQSKIQNDEISIIQKKDSLMTQNFLTTQQSHELNLSTQKTMKTEPDIQKNNDNTVVLKLIKKTKQIRKGSQKEKVQNVNITKSQSSKYSTKKLKKKNSRAIRKSKYNQSKTQKFIYLMTQFHYSKNFRQYYEKKIKQNTKDGQPYSNLSPAQRATIIDIIINGLKDYRMGIHYKVQSSQFITKFTHNQQILIRQFFWTIIQKTYKLKLEPEKNYINSNQKDKLNQDQKFFSKQADQQFSTLFEQTLKEEPYAQGLKNSHFLNHLEIAILKNRNGQCF